ncbi:4-(cytidine 5'-diphospho)-2-C-methyl-D-erythritol kinase [Cereibacter sp. SYSU M97828]|nr:4-(cytidine 5'-diphospho)-2-C-methyl-D-erythritol kinase [Cereibacter flavus]
MATDAFARAKVNLTLHVTGRRADGYHLLDSLVVFAGVGDTVTASDGPMSLTVDGPEAQALVGENLVTRAAALMGGARLHLEKRLPVASGIGGGSADAAATLRALERMGRPLPDPRNVLGLGADVPVCLFGRAVRMTGVGEGLEPVAVPPAWLVLANPRVAVSTPQVFRGLDGFGPPMPEVPAFADAAALAHWLHATRNDMEPAAIRIAPVIAEVKAALATLPGCLFARMSGSGATCFGLFRAEAEARAGAAALPAEWWTAAAPMEG